MYIYMLSSERNTNCVNGQEESINSVIKDLGMHGHKEK